MDASKEFDASRYMMQIKGKDYLPVAPRILWLRSQHADATISTELVTFTAEISVVRAVVVIPNGGSATGYGSETPQGFTDYLERAETRAIGRALGALGFGTLACAEFDADTGENGHVADSPIARPPQARPAPRPAQTIQRPAPSMAAVARTAR